MTNADLHIEYSRHTGNGLDTVKAAARHNGPISQPYVDWLEEKVIVLTRGIEAWEAANTISTAAHKAVHGKRK